MKTILATILALTATAAAQPVEPTAPAPVEAAPPAEPPPPTVTKPPPAPTKDDYYVRRGGAFGIFHSSRLSVGLAMGDAPELVSDPNGGPSMPTGADRAATMGTVAFEAAYLALPSSYGNFHGIEMSTGLRSSPIDFWFQFGTAVTFFNLGRGGPGSFRLGGSFGAGFNFAHGYGYVRGRAALVVIPRKLDAELSVQWTPPSASTSSFDEQTSRISLWYRYGKSRKAVEAYIEQYRRKDDTQIDKREFDGYAFGVGWSLF